MKGIEALVVGLENYFIAYEAPYYGDDFLQHAQRSFIKHYLKTGIDPVMLNSMYQRACENTTGLYLRGD